MREIYILNPAAGQGGALNSSVPENVETYVTKSVGDCTDYVEKTCRENPETRFYVCGGDGTISEAVTGIMRAGAGDTAEISIVPTGTGNDFVRSFNGKKGKFRTDVIKCGDTYAVNMINTGFDCDVVTKASEYKLLPLVSGSLAYYLGVASVLTGKLGNDLEISYENENGEEIKASDKYLLALVGNGGYYGGGFNANPCGETDDGLLELLLVKKVSRPRFIALVSDYKNGRHIFKNTDGKLTVIKKFQKFVSVERIKKVLIRGMKHFCADGEVDARETVAIEVIPKALNFVF